MQWWRYVYVTDCYKSNPVRKVVLDQYCIVYWDVFQSSVWSWGAKGVLSVLLECWSQLLYLILLIFVFLFALITCLNYNMLLIFVFLCTWWLPVSIIVSHICVLMQEYMIRPSTCLMSQFVHWTICKQLTTACPLKVCPDIFAQLCFGIFY